MIAATQANIAGCWTELSFNVTENLWTLTLLLALIFQGEMERDGTSGEQHFDFALQINVTTRTHPPCRSPEMLFLTSLQECHVHGPHILIYRLFLKAKLHEGIFS